MPALIRVWDLPLRLFHWALVLCVSGLLITSQLGGEAMVWHFRFGYTVLTLLLFRLVWGLMGGYWSRFTSFPMGLRSLLAYGRGQYSPGGELGHSPMASWAVVAMLLALMLQVGSGLFSDDEIMAAGPLTALVANKWVTLATSYHTTYGKFLILGLIGLHLSALAFYSWVKHKPLVKAMFTGDQISQEDAPSSTDGPRQRVLALCVLLLCGLLVAGALSLVPPH
jgi:cytochrome b